MHLGLYLCFVMLVDNTEVQTSHFVLYVVDCLCALLGRISVFHILSSLCGLDTICSKFSSPGWTMMPGVHFLMFDFS